MRQSCHHIETSQLICRANQLTGFYMMVTYAFNELTDVTTTCGQITLTADIRNTREKKPDLILDF